MELRQILFASMISPPCEELLTSYTGQELAGKLLDLVGWERTERVVLEPVVDRLSQQFKHHADMVPVIKDFVQMETFTVEEKENSMSE